MKARRSLSNESRLKRIYLAELSARNFLRVIFSGEGISWGRWILRRRNFSRRNFWKMEWDFLLKEEADLPALYEKRSEIKYKKRFFNLK